MNELKRIIRLKLLIVRLSAKKNLSDHHHHRLNRLIDFEADYMEQHADLMAGGDHDNGDYYHCLRQYYFFLETIALKNLNRHLHMLDDNLLRLKVSGF